MTSKEFDATAFRKGMRCTLDATIVAVDFEKRKFRLRIDGKATSTFVPADKVTLQEDKP